MLHLCEGYLASAAPQLGTTVCDMVVALALAIKAVRCCLATASSFVFCGSMFTFANLLACNLGLLTSCA